MRKVNLAPNRKDGLVIRNPVLIGPGVIGYGREYGRLFPLEKLGAIITNTSTLNRRSGHGQPRLLETPSGVMLSTGLQNPGLRTVLQRHATAWSRLDVPVILSLAGEDARAFVQCAALAEESAAVAALALEGDLLAKGPDLVRVVDALRAATQLPLIAHMATGAAQAVADAITDVVAVGADAVIVGSPWPAMAPSPPGARSPFRAGLAGPAIRPLALRLVHEVVQSLGHERPPIIAAGGIAGAADAAAFLAVGAAAVLVDVALFTDPLAAVHIVDGLAERREG